MTWEQLRVWVNDPVRTEVELAAACGHYGIPTGTKAEMITRLLVHIASQPNLTAVSGWNPTAPPVVTPAPAPVQPAPVPPPPPPTQQSVQGFNWSWLPWILLAGLGGLLLGMVLFWRTTSPAPPSGGTPSAVAAAPTYTPYPSQPTLTPYPTVVPAPATQVPSTAVPPATATQAPPPAPSATPATGGTAWTPVVKCEWLRANWPQSLSAIQNKVSKEAGVPRERIADHLYPCGQGVTVHDGAIILGPQEGPWSQPFTLSVNNPGGAIDVYPGAVCTGNIRKIGQETIRCESGQVVNVLRATIWPWDDERPPVTISGVVPTMGHVVSSSPTPTATTVVSSVQCQQPEDLAKSKGWKVMEWADRKFGGLRVELSKADSLPDKWEAIASGRSIKENDTDRLMVATVWTVYPPYACREQLGFSK